MFRKRMETQLKRRTSISVPIHDMPKSVQKVQQKLDENYNIHSAKGFGYTTEMTFYYKRSVFKFTPNHNLLIRRNDGKQH